VDVSNDPWIAEVEQGIVDHEVVVGRRVEDGEICVLQSGVPKIGDGECACMEGNCVKGGALGTSPLKVHVVSYGDISDVLGDFFPVLFVDEDEGVMLGIAPIVEHPFPSGMVCLVLVAADRDVGGGRGGGRDALEERRRLILHFDCIDEIWFDEVCECQDVCKVGDGVVFFNGDG
jgi:hypothetical protein